MSDEPTAVGPEPDGAAEPVDAVEAAAPAAPAPIDTAAPEPEPAPSTRVPALVQAGVIGVVMALVAAVSLTARQPPPPSVAEYAPQAVAQIEQAPPEQTQDQGRGGQETTTTTAASGAGGANSQQAGSSTTTTAPNTIDKPRVRRCIGVGRAARQTEDPQSPPCVAYFDPKTSNGGATSRGVTADKVNVVFTPDFLESDQFPQDLASFFNRRYEFYGRQINLLSFFASGGADPNPALMQGDAENAYSLEAFASLNYASKRGAEYTYYNALADRKVISVSHRVQAEATDANLRRRAPYQWSVVPTVDSMLRNYGQFICGSLAGKRPQWAGGSEADASARVFGAIVQEATDGTRPDTKPLEDEMNRCGAKLAAKVNNRASSETGRTGTRLIQALAEADVTSVICLCDAVEIRDVIMPAAAAQVYNPEWLVSSYLDLDLDNSMNGAPPDQAARAFGLSFRNKLLPKQDMPFYWALKEVNPAADPQGGSYYSIMSRYLSLLVLASGIQLAGPHLTPESFAAGLLRTQWANPGAGAPPSYQAPAGFDGGRRTFIDDASLIWHVPSRRSRVDPDATGAVCYVGGGTRYRLGEWPAKDHAFFTPGCP